MALKFLSEKKGLKSPSKLKMKTKLNPKEKIIHYIKKKINEIENRK